MAGQPHDKSGKQCAVCEVVFSKNSFTITRSKPKSECLPNMDEKILVCASCHHEFYSKGE